MPTCQVRGCDRTDMQPIREANVTFALCVEHSLAIRGGEQHTYLPDTREVLIGPDALPELINVITTLTVGNASEIVELHLGRDGVVEHRIQFQVSDETKNKLGTSWVQPNRES